MTATVVTDNGTVLDGLMDAVREIDLELLIVDKDIDSVLSHANDWLRVGATLNDSEHVRSDDLDGVVVIVGATDDDTVCVRWHFAPPYSSLQ